MPGPPFFDLVECLVGLLGTVCGVPVEGFFIFVVFCPGGLVEGQHTPWLRSCSGYWTCSGYCVRAPRALRAALARLTVPASAQATSRPRSAC